MNPRRLQGCAVGLVSNLKDPNQFGRIQVKFPWLHDSESSYWCRIVSTQGGGSRGDFIRPEVGDEVLVMYEQGDPNQPCVVGVLWNGKDKIPGPGNSDGKNDHKFFQSRSGHQMIFNDGSDGGYIQFHDCKQKLHTKIDVPGKHIHWKADSGTIQLSAPKGKIRMECKDFVLHSTQSTNQKVAKQHKVSVTATRTYKAKTLTQTAGSSLSISTPNLSLSAKVLTSSSGATSASIGSMEATIDPQVEMEFNGPVTRTVSAMSKIEAKTFRTENEHGPSGPITLTGASILLDTGAMAAHTGAALTVNGGAITVTSSKIVLAKDSQNGQGVGKASMISLLGGAVLLNPMGIVGPATKMLDMVMGADFHNQAPGVNPVPLPFAPHAFTLPLLLDVKPTVLVNCMPTATSGTTAIGVHIPPTYLPANSPIPMTYRMLINSAIVALFVPAVIAAGTLAIGLVQAHAAGTSPQAVLMGGASSGGEAAWRWFRGAFPMTQSVGAFVAFLAGLMPYPVANGSISIGSPNVTAEESPMSLVGQMFCNSCSDIPVVPNAAVLGFSNVMVGITLGALLQQMALRVATGLLTLGGGKLMEKVNPPKGGPLDRTVFPSLQEFNPTAPTNAPTTHQSECQGEGHPVDPVSGTLYDKEIDAQLPGPLPFKLERNYNSVAVRKQWGGMLGLGWRTNLESVLTLHYGKKGGPRFWLRHDEEMRVQTFPFLKEVGERYFDVAERLELVRTGEKQWDVLDRDGLTWRYEEHAKDRARLACWFDRNANQITLHYDRDEDQPRALTDSAGRRIVLRYTDDRLTSLWCEGSGGGWTGRELCAWRYDQRGRLIEVERGDRSKRRFVYDDQHRMIRDVEAGGYAWTFHYDDSNRVTTTYGEDLHEYAHLQYEPLSSMTVVTDHSGRKRLYKYDKQGHITTRVEREGDARQFTWDETGSLASEVDGNGGATELKRDPQGRLLEKMLPDGGKYLFTYDENGFLVREEAPGGAVTTHAVDARGNRLRTRHPDGSTTLRRHDDRGLLVGEIRADGTEHAFEYDAAGNLTSETHEGVTTRHSYDALGNRILTTLPGGKRVQFSYDGRGRMLTRELPDGRVERWRYDPNGELLEYTGADGNTWTEVRDPMGRRTERRSPDGLVLRSARGTNNRFASHLDAQGHGWRYFYDANDRLVRVQTTDGVTERYERDLAGHVIATRYDDEGWRKYENDPVGRPLEVETRDGTRQSFKRDAAGRVIESIELPPGTAARTGEEPQAGERRVAWRRASDGAALEEIGPFGRVRQKFGPNGHLVRLDVDGIAIEIVRDGQGGILAIRAPDGMYRCGPGETTSPRGVKVYEDAGGWTLTDAAGRPTMAYDAERDANGRFVNEKLTTTQRFGWRHRHQFDRSGRLAERYDRSGNRELNGARYADGRRLVADEHGEVRYDRRGRVVSRAVAGGLQRLWWDDLERLREVEQPDGTVIQYRYDALSRLIERLEDRVDGSVSSWRYLWCEQRLVGENRPDGTKVRYLHLRPQDVVPWAAWIEGPWGRGLVRLHRDARGAIIAASDEGGGLLWLGEYEPYGACQARDRGFDQRLRLPGMWADPATGLYYNRFRWYVPEWGRYLSPDPLGVSGGDHPYAYAEGDPIHRVDPLGLSTHNRQGTTGDNAEGQPRTQGTQPTENGVFIVTPEGVVLPPGKDVNLVPTSQGTKGEFLQIHQSHDHGNLNGESGIGAHTHRPEVNTSPTGVSSTKRVTSATTADDINAADTALRNGTMRERTGRKDTGDL